MENLIIKRRNQLLNKRVLGALWISIGTILLIMKKDQLDKGDWIIFIVFCLIGMIHFTPLAGSDISQIEISDGCLKIIWITWIRKITVPDSEIEGITLASKGILIKRKDKKPLKINFYLIEKEQRNQVYEFFTEYAKQKNFVLEK